MRFLDGVACLVWITAAAACAAEGPETNQDETGGCETGGVCADDTDCGAGTRCNGDVCTRLNCLPDNSPCDTNEVCKSQACANGPPGNVCLTGPRPAGWACSAMYGCATGTECILGLCTVPNLPEGELCTADEQCATGLFCQTATCVAGATGQCARPASTDVICCEASDCASPYACVNVSCSGTLQRRCGLLSGTGQLCCDNSDCEAGLVCDPAAGFNPECQPVGGGSMLRVTPESLTLSMVQGGPPPMPATISVSNAGTGTLDFSANPSPDLGSSWLMVEPYGGTLVEGQGPVELTVTVIDAVFEVGTLEGSIVVGRSNDFSTPPLEIPVTFTISPP